MFEEQADFFARDVVLTGDVVAHVQRTLRFISATRIGRILAKPPFNGVAKKLRVGDKRYRVVVIRNHEKWEVTPHNEIMNHIEGEDSIDIMS